jgi:hypothetical protein
MDGSSHQNVTPIMDQPNAENSSRLEGAIRANLQALAGEVLNLNRPEQLVILFDGLTIRTKTAGKTLKGPEIFFARV